MGLVNRIGSVQIRHRLGGIRLKMGGGEGGGVGLVHGTRYTRIPDPAHDLSGRGGARGEERKTDNHRIRGPIKNI